jgi:hypothetical protein
MEPRVSQSHYLFLASTIFAIVAALQLLRAVKGWSVTVGGAVIPVWASWVAFVVAGLLAWIGFRVGL